jgi:hypothetical protein
VYLTYFLVLLLGNSRTQIGFAVLFINILIVISQNTVQSDSITISINTLFGISLIFLFSGILQVFLFLLLSKGNFLTKSVVEVTQPDNLGTWPFYKAKLRYSNQLGQKVITEKFLHKSSFSPDDEVVLVVQKNRKVKLFQSAILNGFSLQDVLRGKALNLLAHPLMQKC